MSIYAIVGAESRDLTEVLTPTAGVTASTAQHHGAGGYSYAAVIATTGTASFIVPTNGGATTGVRFWLYLPALPGNTVTLVRGINATGPLTTFTLQLLAGGQVQITNPPRIVVINSAAVLNTGAWNLIQFLQAPTTYALQINGVPDSSGPITWGNGSTITQLTFGVITATSACTLYFDDIALDSAALPANGQCVLLQCAATGTDTGGRDVPSSPADVLFPNTPATRWNDNGSSADRTWTVTPNAAIVGTVNCCATKLMVLGTVATSSYATLARLRTGGALFTSAIGPLTSAYSMLTQPYPVNPGTGTAWTPAASQAVESGLSSDVANGYNLVSSLGWFVDFLPPPIVPANQSPIILST